MQKQFVKKRQKKEHITIFVLLGIELLIVRV